MYVYKSEYYAFDTVLITLKVWVKVQSYFLEIIKEHREGIVHSKWGVSKGTFFTFAYNNA